MKQGCQLFQYAPTLFEVCGEKQVPVIANNDKRQITAVVGCSFNGKLLAPQLLYEGKTDRCHPSVLFPADWDIFHTESHWSNSASIIRYIDNVLRPYFDKQKELLDLPVEQKSLLIFGVFLPIAQKMFSVTWKATIFWLSLFPQTAPLSYSL